METADITVLCNVPFGPNNTAILEALPSARQLVIIEGTPLMERDFTGGATLHFFEGLNPVARPQGTDEVVACVLSLAPEKTGESQP